MKVSIVTAVRNGEAGIGHSLRSVAAQSHPDIEHIVIDGASSDRTIDLVRSEGTRVAKVISEADSGVYEAFNKGLRLSTGDIVGYLNSGDEYVGSRVIAAIVDQFEASDVDAVFGDLLIVDERHREKMLRWYRSSLFRPSRVKYGFMPAHPTLFIRRAIYERFGGYKTNFRIAGDFELVARLFVRHRISYSYLPRILVRMPKGGLSTQGPYANWLITKEMRHACKGNAIETGLLRLLARIPVKLAEYSFDRVSVTDRLFTD